MADPESGTSEGKKEHEIYESRLEKARKWRELGFNPWGNGYRPEHLAADVIDAHREQSAEQLEYAVGPAYHVAGRVIALRSFGKAAFLKLRDRSGEIQVHLKKDVLGDGYELFRLTDLGDLVAVIGTPFRSKTGELTLAAAKFFPVTKSLRALPEKWHGLVDVETRYRQRYLDLISNPEVKEVFRKRIELIRFTREFFDARDFLEVETPMMHPLVSGANARPFITHHNALDIDLYLRIAPELYLKRLVVGGLDRVYEINRNFRNEGISTRHNPEFTMLEFYEAYRDYDYLMDLTEDLLRQCAQGVLGTTTLAYQGATVDLGKKFDRLTMAEAIAKYNPKFALHELAKPEYLKVALAPFDVEVFPSDGVGLLQLKLFEATTEEKLVDPTFIVAHPVDVSPLARANDANPEVTDRFELFINGREIANGFSELNDPEDQAARFQAQARAKEAGD